MKSGTASAEIGAPSEEETCKDAELGSVQDTTATTRAEKLCDALAEIGATGRGCGLAVDCETQQDLLHEQHPWVAALLVKFVGADATA